MSRPLPGMHHCKNHQSNGSHYAEHNCQVCKLERENTELRAKLSQEQDIRNDLSALVELCAKHLGVEQEPHQTFTERLLEKTKHLSDTEAKLADIRADQTECNEANETQARRIADLEAKLDAIMLEFCPDEMTDEQRERFKKAIRAKEEKS